MIRDILKSISSERWNIGFVENNLHEIMNGETLRVKWLKHNCKNSWFADPFILDVTDDEICVLVEEFYKPFQRGRISRLIVDKKTYELKQLNVALELPTHLSFPAIIRKDDGIYIYPENGESGKLCLYQYIPDKNECIRIETILNESVADSVISRINGEELLFCTKQPNQNGNILYIYRKNVLGSFVQIGKYIFDENVARMAGDFFEFGGHIYRPAQECNIQYGHAVVLQKVDKVNDAFLFSEKRRLYSVHPQLNVGMHTFSTYKNVIVTDALGFDNMWIRKILKGIGVLH